METHIVDLSDSLQKSETLAERVQAELLHEKMALDRFLKKVNKVEILDDIKEYESLMTM